MTADEFNLALKSLGLRQRKLAEALGVHRSTVNHWSRGKAAVPQYAALCLSLMQKLADGIKLELTIKLTPEDMEGGYTSYTSEDLPGFRILCQPKENPLPLLQDAIKAFLPPMLRAAAQR